MTRYGTAVRNEKNNKQPTLFGDIKEMEIPKPKLPEIPEWTKSHTLKLERDAIGIYLSAHPLDDYKFEIEHFTTCETADLQNIENFVNSDVAIAGIVTSEQVKATKNNEPYGRYEIEDYTGTYEFALFRDNYKNFSPLLRKDFFVLVKGRVEIPRWKKGDDVRPEFFVKEIIMLSEIREKYIKRVRMKVPLTEITDDFIEDFAKIIDKTKGNVTVTIVVEDKDDNLFTELYPKREKIIFNNNFLKFVKNYDIELSIN